MKKKTVILSLAGAAVVLGGFGLFGYEYSMLGQRFQALETEAFQLQEENASLNQQLDGKSSELKENISKVEEQEKYIAGQKDYVSELTQQIQEYAAKLPKEDADEESGEMEGTDDTDPYGETEQDPYPDLYAQEHGSGISENQKYVYLTFDDGPSELTPQVLDLLDEYGAKATFFVVCKNNEEYAEYLPEIVKRGHTLALHSYSHDYHTIYRSLDAFLEDYEKVFDWVKKETGYTPSLFRFPGGSNNGSSYVRKEIIQEMERRGFVYYDWNVSSGDGSNLTTTENIIDNICSNVGYIENPVVLMHDGTGKQATLNALPSVLKYLAEEGYEFRSLDKTLQPVQF